MTPLEHITTTITRKRAASEAAKDALSACLAAGPDADRTELYARMAARQIEVERLSALLIKHGDALATVVASAVAPGAEDPEVLLAAVSALSTDA